MIQKTVLNECARIKLEPVNGVAAQLKRLRMSIITPRTSNNSNVNLRVFPITHRVAKSTQPRPVRNGLGPKIAIIMATTSKPITVASIALNPSRCRSVLFREQTACQAENASGRPVQESAAAPSVSYPANMARVLCLCKMAKESLL